MAGQSGRVRVRYGGSVRVGLELGRGWDGVESALEFKAIVRTRQSASGYLVFTFATDII